MNRNHSHWIILLLTLTVSAALMHEVVVHDNATCTVCVQFHGTPPIIDHDVTDFVFIDNTKQSIQLTFSNPLAYSRPAQSRSIRAPPHILI